MPSPPPPPRQNKCLALHIQHCAGTLMAYDSGILSDSCVEINHAVLLVGCALLTFARSPDSIST